MKDVKIPPVDRRRFLEFLGLGAGAVALGSACRSDASGQSSDGDTPTGDGEVSDTTATTATQADSVTEAEVNPSARAPNVLLIVVDQERFLSSPPPDLALPGHAWFQARGTTFLRHYANAMPCTPSRSVLYTGHHVPDTTMKSNIGFAGQGDMPTTIPTLGTLLGQRGYRTAYLGKWHLSTIEAGDNCATPTTEALAAYGFAEYNACGDLPGKVRSGNADDPGTATAAAEWLRARGAESEAAPWCLAVNFVNPHDIMFFYPGGLGSGNFGFAAPADPLYLTRYDVSLPDTAREDLSNRPAVQQAYRKMYDAMQSYPENPVGDQLLERFINYYYTCIADADRHIMTVLDALEASGALDQTIVVFTSDHGEMGQVHGLRGKGPFIYEQNNHVPLVIVHPDLAPGRSTSALTCHADLVPTMLALVGQPQAETAAKSPGLAGHDLGPVLRDVATAGPRSELLMTFEFMGTIDTPGANAQLPAMAQDVRSYMRGYFDGRWKFARFFDVGDYHTPADWDELVARNDLELYDLESDPNERVNLGAHPVANRAVIEPVWRRLEALITQEIGTDFTSG